MDKQTRIEIGRKGGLAVWGLTEPLTKWNPAMPVRDRDKPRFWSKVNKTETCWLWIGSRIARGYGCFRITYKTYRAHRIAWLMANGLIPLGLSVLHRCDVRNCVNPAHLFLGTQKDNIVDASRKGRIPRGKKRNLTKKARVQMIKLYAAGGVSQLDMAKRFNVTEGAIWFLVNRHNKLNKKAQNGR